MDNKEYIVSLIEKARKAQEVLATYNQEQTDALVRAMGKVIVDNAEEVCKVAISDAKMGDLQGKIGKHVRGIGALWNYLKNKKSVGIIDNDAVNGVVTLAKPMGVVGCVMPSSNPTFTPALIGMNSLKSRNAIICAPHPNSQESSAFAINLMRKAIKELGAPEDLIQIVEDCTIERTGILMKESDVVVAIGGAGIVNAAYSSGTPAYGVGQGNVQVILDKDYDNLEFMVNNVVANRPADNGLPCTGEQCLFIPKERKAEVIDAFVKAKAFHVDDPKMVELFRDKLFGTGILNRDLVGKTPPEIAEYMGITIPKDTKMFLIAIDKYGVEEPLCREILGPISKYYVYEDFKDAVAGARANLLNEGAGHSADIYSYNQNMIEYFAEQAPVCRILVNQRGSAAGGSCYDNGFAPTCAIGGGTWGKNSLSENLTYKHLLNFTRISYSFAGTAPSYEETWNGAPNPLATLKM